MPLVPNFSASQLQEDLSIIRFVDTSTGSDGTIAARQIFILNAEDNYVVPTGTNTQYIEWALADITKNVSVLLMDSSYTITVKWVTSGGVTVVQKSETYCFVGRNREFFYYLSQMLTGRHPIIQNTTYFSNAGNLWTSVKSGEYAVEFDSDIQASQKQLNIATNLSQQQSKYF